MYKVYKIVYTGAYGGGLGLLAAEDEKEAQAFIDEHFKMHWEKKYFKLGDCISELTSTKKGIIVLDFYIE